MRYFVSRHPGAVEWARRHSIYFDVHVPHLHDVINICPGDIVIGTLPVHRAAQVCAQGAHYLHLTVDVPAEMRGCELTASDLECFGARLENYSVHCQRPS